MKKLLLILFVCLAYYSAVIPQQSAVNNRLKGFDEYIKNILADWNAPGLGIGIVYKGKLIFAKGYGYRDYEKKLPFTANTLFPIASNTKLFTATGVGMLVEEGKLEWDVPVKEFIPSIEFYNDELNKSVTIRDMLSHRTGISRHDMIWIESDITRKDAFEKLVYLEPSQPLRQGFLYNNLMFASSGYIMELLTQKSWEELTREKILNPLGMNSTVFSIEDMLKTDDHFTPYNEKRDTTLLTKIDYYKDPGALGPAGCIISSIQDISKWLMMWMNNGEFENKQIVSPDVIKEILKSAIALPNSDMENRGYTEVLNPIGGLGVRTASYRGHLLVYHGGDLPGAHSQISYMPFDSLGVIVFAIGDHCQPLYNIITYNIYERLLGLEQTPWNERRLESRLANKTANKDARGKSGSDKIANTNPSHPLSEYVGEYEHPAYGILKIDLNENILQFGFHKFQLPLNHYHYDRFDTPDDEDYGIWSVNFLTNPQGEINKATMSLDEAEVVFIRKVDASMSDPAILKKFTGKYEMGGVIVEIQIKNNILLLLPPGQPAFELMPVKQNKFRLKQFSDVTIQFIIENESVTGFEQTDPSGVFKFNKK